LKRHGFPCPLTASTCRPAGAWAPSEFGAVSRPDLVAGAREAADARFDVVIACAFNFDTHSSEFERLGRIPILKARMNADLHMAGELKSTGSGNLFVVFGEPDIDLAGGGLRRTRPRSAMKIDQQLTYRSKTDCQQDASSGRPHVGTASVMISE
jgi:adenine-specific DNA-methyltransferase